MTATYDTTTDDRAAVVIRFVEQVLNGGDLDRLADLVTPGYRLHGPAVPAPLDAAGHAGFVGALRAAFPDWRETVEDIVAEGDRVVTRVVAGGTHRGDFMGIPATGRAVRVDAVQIDRFEGNRIADRWLLADAAGMLRQLGAAPAATSAN